MRPSGDLDHSYERSKLCRVQSAISQFAWEVSLNSVENRSGAKYHCALFHPMPRAPENEAASVTTSRAQLRQIGFLPLLALFYGYTAGGPFGYEEIFQGSGPGMSLVFLTFVP